MRKRTKDVLQITVLVLVLVVLVYPLISNQTPSGLPENWEYSEPLDLMNYVTKRQLPNETEFLLSEKNLIEKDQVRMSWQSVLRQAITDPRFTTMEIAGYLHSPERERHEDINKLIYEDWEIPRYDPDQGSKVLELLLEETEKHPDLFSRINWEELEERIRLMEDPPETTKIDGFNMEPVRSVLEQYRQ